MSRDLWQRYLKYEVQNFGVRRVIYHLHYFLSPIFESEKYFPKEGEILEVGCGEGMFCGYLHSRSTDRQITAIDSNESRINRAQRQRGCGINYICIDACDLELNKKFDAIGLIHCLYLNSVDKQIDILNHCRKMLKPNGQLIVHAVDITRPGTELTMKMFFNLIRLIGKILELTAKSSSIVIGSREEGPWNWRREELSALITKHGFVVKEVEVQDKRLLYPYFIFNCTLSSEIENNY